MLRTSFFGLALALGLTVPGFAQDAIAPQFSPSVPTPNSVPAYPSQTEIYNLTPLPAAPEVVSNGKLFGLIAPSDHAFDGFISPMTNPIYFEDPRTLTEARLIFANHALPSAVPR